MKITKYLQSCLLVEMPSPVNRTVLFDPGSMSAEVLDVANLKYLDDIVITHAHPDHLDLDLIKALVAKFPNVRITTTQEAADQLSEEAIAASTEAPDGMTFFDAPHESVEPLFPQPQEIGVHYLDTLTHPGDSHSFSETKAILALPVTAPWGSNINAIRLALKLKPQFVLPIHDWHWSDAARIGSYDRMEKVFGEHDIKFSKLQTGQPVVLEV